MQFDEDHMKSTKVVNEFNQVSKNISEYITNLRNAQVEIWKPEPLILGKAFPALGEVDRSKMDFADDEREKQKRNSQKSPTCTVYPRSVIGEQDERANN